MSENAQVPALPPDSLYCLGSYPGRDVAAASRRDHSMPQTPNSLERVKLLLDALSCGAALVDRGGVLVHLNDRLCQMMRRPCNELVGQSLLDLYPSEEDRAVLRDSLNHFDEAREAEFFLPLPDD